MPLAAVFSVLYRPLIPAQRANLQSALHFEASGLTHRFVRYATKLVAIYGIQHDPKGRAACATDGVTWHTFASRLAMSGQAEDTIATLLRHSTTSLVRRYAHLSPTHLKTAVETVASFGKASKIRRNTPQAKTEQSPTSNGTVTKTVTEGNVAEGTAREVVENVGAGDGI